MIKKFLSSAMIDRETGGHIHLEPEGTIPEDTMPEDTMPEGTLMGRENVIFPGEKQLKPGDIPPKITSSAICIYSIKTTGQKPFITFLLHKKNNTLVWPTTSEYTGESITTILSKLQSAFALKNVIYKGTYEYNGQQQLWFENTDNISTLTLENKKKQYIWCLVSEIVNIRRYLNMQISLDVTNFFLNNTEFIYLYHTNGTVFDTPTIGYHGNYYKKIALVAAIGLKREPPQASFGSFYYFGNYERAIRFSIWTNNRKSMKIQGKLITVDEKGKYTRGGLVRFALFLGNTTAIIKMRDDKSFDKYETFYKKGIWIYDYDTVIQGKKHMEYKGENIVLQPQIIIKSFEQQLPLSYYYIDTKQKLDIDNLDKVYVE